MAKLAPSPELADEEGGKTGGWKIRTDCLPALPDQTCLIVLGGEIKRVLVGPVQSLKHLNLLWYHVVPSEEPLTTFGMDNEHSWANAMKYSDSIIFNK